MFSNLRLPLPGEKFSELFYWTAVLLKGATIWVPKIFWDGRVLFKEISGPTTEISRELDNSTLGLFFLIPLMATAFVLSLLIKSGLIQLVPAVIIGYTVHTAIGFLFSAITAD